MGSRHRVQFSPDELGVARVLEGELDRLVAAGTATLVTDSVAALAPAVLLASGYKGKVRYLDWLPNTKVLTDAEWSQAVAAAFPVSPVWESSGNPAVAGGASQGALDGAEAARQLAVLGCPRRFVWVVAEDPSRVAVGQWPTIVAYLAVFASKLPGGVAQLGGYGSQALVEHLLTSGAVSKGWQVGGWSTSVSQLPGMCLYQRLYPTIADAQIKGEVDEDVALQADWGQNDVPPPTPTPAPSPTPTPGDDVTPADITAIANEVILQLRQEETPGSELSDREKALVQNIVNALMPEIVQTAVSTYMQTAGSQVVREACAEALSAYNLPVNPNPPLT